MIRSILLCGLVAFSLGAYADTPAPAAATATPAPHSSTLAAVAATTSAVPAAASAVAATTVKKQLNCEWEPQLGSHMMSRICMTPEQMAERKKAAQEAMRRLQAGKPCVTSGAGC